MRFTSNIAVFVERRLRSLFSTAETSSALMSARSRSHGQAGPTVDAMGLDKGKARQLIRQIWSAYTFNLAKGVFHFEVRSC